VAGGSGDFLGGIGLIKDLGKWGMNTTHNLNVTTHIFIFFPHHAAGSPVNRPFHA